MSTITDATCWTAMPNGSDGLHVIDIIVDRPEGGHVASVASFQVYGEACADTWAHASLIAAAPVLLCLLRQARAALPDAWSAVRGGVPRGLIEEIDAAIEAATAAPPSPSLLPTPPVSSRCAGVRPRRAATGRAYDQAKMGRSGMGRRSAPPSAPCRRRGRRRHWTPSRAS